MDEKEELNRWCHTVLLGKCCHLWRQARSTVPESQGKVCRKCGLGVRSRNERLETLEKAKPMPNYCSSLDLALIVEAKAIERVGWNAYDDALIEVLKSETQQACITASAETRCKAARAAVEGEA